jgi:hypothetical protein
MDPLDLVLRVAIRGQERFDGRLITAVNAITCRSGLVQPIARHPFDCSLPGATSSDFLLKN